MNAQGRFASSIVLGLALALFASIVSSPSGLGAQAPTVVAAPHQVVPYPQPSNPKRGMDIGCPIFYRFKMPGMDILYVRYSDEDGKTTDVSLSFDRFVVTRGKNTVPLARPLPADGGAQRWELIMSETVRNANGNCRPDFSPTPVP